MQAELLRVVQERTYKRVGGNTWRGATFRLVCATNRDLRTQETRGNFRLDFYHRIASATVHLPPLRERREDILPLARHFLREARSGEVEGFAPAVEEFLLAREYTGNVRELRQLVHRLAKTHVGPGPLSLADIPDEDRCAMFVVLDVKGRNKDFEQPVRRALAAGANLQAIKELAADIAVDIALRDASGNAGRAAERLGVSRRAVEVRKAGRKPDAEAGGHEPQELRPKESSPLSPHRRL
jgi:DNA-binding NtrC family response regulator